MTTALHLLVRLVHVLGMAVLVGGTAGAWYLLYGSDRPLPPHATRFEWAFWGALGVMVLTGVGNMGALGPPGPATRWGTLLTAKLLVVLVTVGVSAVRTFAVLRTARAVEWDERPPSERGGPNERLPRLYALTLGLLVVVVALAEGLAHG